MPIRKEATALSTAEQQRYITCINTLLADPSNPYGKMVAVHADMNHNMHGMNEAGTQRFLSWHRDYLLQFEQMLAAIDPLSFVPYWDWTQTRNVPAWMRTFKPTVNVPGYGVVPVKRNASIPAVIDLTAINGFSAYRQFSDTLENGPHGDVHMQLGFINNVREAMANIRVSPSDPIFWLHHGQLDKVWNEWQVQNAGQTPTLTGNDRIMDPWPETAVQLRSITALGYSYA